MGTLSIQGTATSITVAKGTLLTTALKQAGITLEVPCGGKGTCGRCLVHIVSGTVDTDSLGLLSQEVLDEGFVLACKTRLTDDAVTVSIPGHLTNEAAEGKFSDSDDDISLVDRHLFPTPQEIKNPVHTTFLQIEQPQEGDGFSDLDRITNALAQQGVEQQFVWTRNVLTKLPAVLRKDNQKCTISTISSYQPTIIDIHNGHTKGTWYGIAVDLGTTTIAVQLVDLSTGALIGTTSDYNKQISCGSDVISRINYARKTDGLEELRKFAIEAINCALALLLTKHSIPENRVVSCFLSGNTTMVHLLLGIEPETIRSAPYVPVVLHVPHLNAEDVGFAIHPLAPVDIAPSVGSYLGGDITSGLLCTQLATGSEELILFLDIGTNGEMVIGNNEFLLGCACSAGPAFEGSGISCGMRAATGAIEGVEIDPENGNCSWWTIGNVAPTGICGSGIIALMAGLFTTGWLDAAGQFNRTRPSPSIRINGRHAEYILVPAAQSATNKDLIITEQDINNLIRAKAAIFSATQLLLSQVDLTVSDVSKMYIAGGFGRFLSIDNAKIIGLVPDLPDERFHFIGNSSLIGTSMALISPTHRERRETLARKITYIDLMSDPGYMDSYTAALFLPHTDKSLFPSVVK